MGRTRQFAIAVFIAATIGMLPATSARAAMDSFTRVWLRDTVIGAAGGLAISLVSEPEHDSVNWILAGAIVGAMFGYFDADKGLVGYTPERGWHLGAPVMSLEVEHTPQGDKPMVSALLVHAEW